MNPDSELASIQDRIQAFQKKACAADQVVIALGCSDSRVRFPDEYVLVHDADGNEIRVLFIMLPTIGGGSPSRSRMKRVLSDLISWGVNREKIRILVTQHGSTTEVTQRVGHHGCEYEPRQLVSCGLRNFFAQYAEQLSHIHTLLNAWGDRYKQTLNNPSHVLDSVKLPELERACPEAYKKICEVALQASSAEYSLPKRLVLRAAYRNTTFDIEENGESVRAKVSEILRETEFSDIFSTCLVGLADYDHNKKRVLFAHPYSSLGWKESIVEFTTLPERTVEFQDPTAIAITFSRVLLPIPDSVLYPSLCTIPDNTFRASVSTPSEEILLCAFSEASYAVLHHLGGHDANFKQLSDLLITCDTPEHMAIVQNIHANAEYIQDFKKMFDAFLPNGFTLIDAATKNSLNIPS